MSRRVAGLVLLVASPVLAAAFPSALRIPPRSDRPAPPPALFSHRTHATFACQSCHPSTFPQAAAGFTHREMSEGRFCGGCHDGRLAFAIGGATCTRCHAPTR